MSTYTQILCHIVFATKNRQRVLVQARREDLFRYVWGIIKNHQCHLYRIAGLIHSAALSPRFYRGLFAVKPSGLRVPCGVTNRARKK